MDFAALPPEINSARLTTGPGITPMLNAATAWTQLADNLYSAAGAYRSIIDTLTGAPWRGPASASMAAAAATYVAWVTATAGTAQQSATQAGAAAAAFEAAHAMTVPLPVVAANRALLMALIATNVLGQNTPAIMVAEADYAEMWAQDATAMYGYAADSAAAAALTPFTSPPPTTTTASAGPAGALAQAATGAPTVSAGSSQVLGALPAALQGLTSPLDSTSFTAALSSLDPLTTAMSMGSSSGWISSALLSNANQVKNLMTPAAAAAAAGPAAGVGGGLPSGAAAAASALPGPTTGVPATTISAGMGRATPLGGLSLPPTWTTAIAPPASTAAALPPTTPALAPPNSATSPATMLGGLPPPTPARGIADKNFPTGVRSTVIPRSPSAG